MKHRGPEKGRASLRRIGAEERVIQLTDRFEFVFHIVIVLQPALDLLPLFGSNADLFVSASGVVDRENPSGMSFASGAGLATFLMPDRTMQQRAAHDFDRLVDQSGQGLALLDHLPTVHLLG